MDPCAGLERRVNVSGSASSQTNVSIEVQPRTFNAEQIAGVERERLARGFQFDHEQFVASSDE